LGIDLSRLALPYLVDYRKNTYGVSADYEMWPGYYLTGEYGEQVVDRYETNYLYRSAGFYTRFGIDYNTLAKKIAADQYEMVFGGARYCFSSFNHDAQLIVIPNNDWGEVRNLAYGPLQIDAHWLEVVGGIRGEIFKNFFIGWSFRARLLLYKTHDEVMDPFFIPGFGRGDRRANIGFTYSVYYMIPFYTVKEKKVPEEEN
jgi:hypothetical protein